MGKIKDRIGVKYGRLTAIKIVEGKKPIYWLCQCDCGNYDEVRASNLQSGAVKSCGCLNNEAITKHNQAHSRLYKVFNSLKQRCINPNNKGYKNYGARGIKVCEEWLDKESGFINFYNWAMANGYDENAKFQECTIDRIDVNGNYEPNNCRWISNKEQALNKTDSRTFKYKGRKQTLKEWSKELNVSYKTLQYHTHKGQSIEEILSGINQRECYKNTRRVVLINKDSNDIFGEFDNIYEACKKIGLKRSQTSSAYKAANGDRKHSYGYIWRYVDGHNS